MSHVRAARVLLPGIVSRRQRYLLSTASAAGLLTHVGAAAYTVTKHAAVAFAEWLSIVYADAGIRVSTDDCITEWRLAGGCPRLGRG